MKYESNEEAFTRLEELSRRSLSTAYMDSLTGIERQELFLLQRHLISSSCPLCRQDVVSYNSPVRCSCGIELRRVIPMVAVGVGWWWDITEESRKTLLKMWMERSL